MRMYLLSFDERIKLGSAEHFYHFVWGYLLPGLAEILGIRADNQTAEPQRILFRSCGPVMDRILHETASLFALDYQLVDRAFDDAAATKIIVPRWDIALATLAKIARMPKEPEIEKLRAETATRLRRNINVVRSALMEKVEALPKAQSALALSGKFLVLKRSPQPEFYATGGKAEVPGYGIARRSLTGQEETVRLLRARDIAAELFEPGAAGFAEQIQIFSGCSGIAGIYGAEFANVAWMPAGTPVFWAYTRAANQVPWITEQLSLLMDLPFHPVEIAEGAEPVLPLDHVLRWYQQFR